MTDSNPVYTAKAPFSDCTKMLQLLKIFEGHCQQVAYHPVTEEFQLLAPDEQLGKILEEKGMKLTVAEGTSFPMLGRN